ncbi:P-loop containing nucleoside triphosphate hydrolase protein [Lineolata rhizophorae]|uniref:P-loop containing nucleoside triphosphate hydrolase protein n=1 Tax=Lineolata rhizophorae TaxID=578093 RepID=A0A6A6NUF0_9PEZI|nr:P-loop containing nucleoside triphosphate hydrolase protein [Lineolata rhizophorae]
MASQEGTQVLSSSSHRLPTISASQALESLKTRERGPISFGLEQLDALLHRGAPGIRYGTWNAKDGLRRGQVVEVYGPPGAGKSTLCMQATASALRGGEHVVWIDAGTPMALIRLRELLKSSLESAGAALNPVDSKGSSCDAMKRLHHLTVPTLAHLLALLIRPPASFPPPETGLIVIDSLSTLFENSYPRNAGSPLAGDAAKWAAGRKYGVMNDLLASLSKIAALSNLAVLISSQTITRIKSGQNALLFPAMSGREWENGVSARLVLFRDWLRPSWRSSQSDSEAGKRWRMARFVGLVKAASTAQTDNPEFTNVIPFTIERTGLCLIDIPATALPTKVLSSPSCPAKRPYAVIADSEGESSTSTDEFDWVEEDAVAAEGLIDVAPDVARGHSDVHGHDTIGADKDEKAAETSS